MGVIMVLGIIGLGFASPIIMPAVLIYSAFESLYYSAKDFFENMGF